MTYPRYGFTKNALYMKSIGQIFGMIKIKISQEIDRTVTDFIHMETMCQTLSLKYKAEDTRYITDHLCSS